MQFIIFKYLIELFSIDCGYGVINTMYLNNKCCKKKTVKRIKKFKFKKSLSATNF